MVEAGVREELDFIVTRSLHDYRKAACKVLSPGELFALLKESSLELDSE